MGVLHELLAVEGDLKGKAQKAKAQALKLFRDGHSLFAGMYQTYEPLEEDGLPKEPKARRLQRNVEHELEQFFAEYGNWMDVVLQKEVTNQEAKAFFGGFDKPLPATALLNLEARLAEIREVINAVPVYDEAQEWTYSEEDMVYKTEQTRTFVTEKRTQPKVGYDATKEHPAQIDWFTDDVRVGTWTGVLFTGAVSPRRKKELLDRVETLLAEVKQARQRANTQEVVSVEISEWLTNRILKG